MSMCRALVIGLASHLEPGKDNKWPRTSPFQSESSCLFSPALLHMSQYTKPKYNTITTHYMERLLLSRRGRRAESPWQPGPNAGIYRKQTQTSKHNCNVTSAQPVSRSICSESQSMSTLIQHGKNTIFCLMQQLKSNLLYDWVQFILKRRARSRMGRLIGRKLVHAIKANYTL